MSVSQYQIHSDTGLIYRGWVNRNIESGRVKIGIHAAAEFLDVALTHLLAEFLKDCERKKIRLLLHSEYEKTIENFLRDAPHLVAELQSKPSEAFTQEIQEHSPVQIFAETRHRIERVEGQEKWLDPYNFDELPLVGREKEIELLDKFIESDGQFKIWAISGPSGSGKTRLTSQWAYDSEVLKDWDCRVLHKEDRTEPEKWAKWSPNKPTLIIIDYLYGFENVVLKLMSRRLESADSKVRLLLLDHIFTTPLHSDKRWGFSGDQSSLNRNEKYFFNLKPLDLRDTQKQEVIIKSIIAYRVGINEKSPQIDEAHEYLSNTQGAYHPLFAALVADAINSGKDFKVWNRRELINYYLSGEKRLPWEYEDLGLNGRWASHFIATATARRGMHYCDLIEATENCSSAPEYLGDVRKICQKVVADNSDVILKPFEPDILGESFFLKFLKFLENSPRYQKEFRQVFMAVDKEMPTKDATELIAFIQRLTRNLLNDDQSQKETQELWQTLFDFMRPSNFENAEPIRWALTAGVIDIADAIKDQFPKEKIISLLNQADSAVFYRVHDSSLLEQSVLYSMLYFELTNKLTKTTPKFSEEMFALFGRYAASEIDDGTPLIIASACGFDEMINILIDRGADAKTKIIYGANALMIASIYGHIEVVNRLLSAGLDIHGIDNENRTALIYASTCGQVEVSKLLLDGGADIHAVDNAGKTALIWASDAGHVEVVKLLLDKGAKIDAADNEGQTALFWAITEGHVEVVKLLLDKGAEIDAADNEVRTMLFWAITSGHVEVVKLLLGKWTEIDAADNEDNTMFFWAIVAGHVEVVKLLLDKGAKIDAADFWGDTALNFAIENGHTDLVKLLLEEGANINAVDNQGRTALCFAAKNRHTDAFNLLFEKGADIHATDNEGWTILMLASFWDHVEAVKLLLEEGANINAIDNQGRTALCFAAKNRHTDAFNLLFEKGADIHATDNEGWTILMLASLYGHVEAVKLLLSNGSDIHATNNKGHTALYYASFMRYVEIVKLLLDEGAGIHAADTEGRAE